MTRDNDSILGILISGFGSSVEVFNPTTGHHCELPSLPDVRTGHTSDGVTLCGGEYTMDTCITFNSGVWVTSHALTEGRYGHCSWTTEEGKIILLGGEFSDFVTEILTEGVYEGVPGFTMQYKAK